MPSLVVVGAVRTNSSPGRIAHVMFSPSATADTPWRFSEWNHLFRKGYLARVSDSDYSVLKPPVIVCIRPANTTRYRLVNNIDRIACSCVLYVPRYQWHCKRERESSKGIFYPVLGAGRSYLFLLARYWSCMIFTTTTCLLGDLSFYVIT